MDTPQTYHGLSFDRRTRPAPRRLIAIGVVLVVFTLLWGIVPASVLYWLLLPLLATLVWMASYGWRQAVRALLDLLYRLEQL